MFSQRSEAGSAEFRIGTTTVSNGAPDSHRIPRKPVTPQAAHPYRAFTPGLMRSVNYASSGWLPKAMEQAPPRAAELQARKKDASARENTGRTGFSSMYGRRDKKKEAKTDKLVISAPIRVTKSSAVPGMVPCMPSASGRTSTRPPVSGVSPGSATHGTASHAIYKNKALPPLPSIANHKANPNKVSREPMEWKSSNPVGPSSSRADKTVTEPDQSRFSGCSWSAVYGDEESPVVDWSSDDEFGVDPPLENFRRASTEVVVDGETTDDRWSLSKHPGPASVPERETAPESSMKNRRAGRVFSLSELTQFPDPVFIAGEEHGSDDEFVDAGFDTEPESVAELYVSAGGLGSMLDMNLDKLDLVPPPLVIPDIRITPSTPRDSLEELVSNKRLSTIDAWKHLAEKYRHQASRSRDEAEQVTEYCQPILKAFELIRDNTEFAHLDSWEGVYEVLEMILKERKYSHRQRRKIHFHAATMKKDYETGYSEVVDPPADPEEATAEQ